MSKKKHRIQLAPVVLAPEENLGALGDAISTEPHPLTQALRGGGLGLDDASHYLREMRRFGQVAFALGEKNEAELALFKLGRSSVLGSLAKAEGAGKMATRLLATMAEIPVESLAEIDGSFMIPVSEKKTLAKKWAQQPGMHLGAVCKVDFAREDLIEFVTASIHSSPPKVDSWERLDLVASRLAMDPPVAQARILGSDDTLRPDLIEERLSERAIEIMERFGLGNIRVSGMPSAGSAASCLSSLEIALEEISKSARMPEKAVGLGGGWTIHINAEVGKASGYCDSITKLIMLSPDNGWKTLAHEWFHAFDFQAANPERVDPTDMVSKWVGVGDQREWIWGTRDVSVMQNVEGVAAAKDADKKSDWEAARLSFYETSLGGVESEKNVRIVGNVLIDALRVAEPGVLEKISSEETATSIARMTEGLYERFYQKRIAGEIEPAARLKFEDLCLRLLEGRAALPEIKAWRIEHLGEKADMCKHYDAFLFAEKIARDSRVEAGCERESAMQSFAVLADKQLAAASGGTDWEGYSSSALEMSARGFEGNCFLDTPSHRRPCLVDGRDNSLYWPAGDERGMHADKYRAFIAAGVRSMIDGGTMPESVMDGFDPRQAPEPLSDFSERLGERRIQERASQERATLPKAAL